MRQVEKWGDEVWVGVKWEWKVEIGGCVGNRFRGRVKVRVWEVEE